MDQTHLPCILCWRSVSEILLSCSLLTYFLTHPCQSLCVLRIGRAQLSYIVQVHDCNSIHARLICILLESYCLVGQLMIFHLDLEMWLWNHLQRYSLSEHGGSNQQLTLTGNYEHTSNSSFIKIPSAQSSCNPNRPSFCLILSIYLKVYTLSPLWSIRYH
jgi:hypothetical protein